jgi:hypothetical protein
MAFALSSTLVVSLSFLATSNALPSGLYFIQQKQTMRYLDAYESSSNDFAAVTRVAQNDPRQKWVVTALRDGAYTIQQKETMRYLDAYDAGQHDWNAVLRPAQWNPSQEWVITPTTHGTFTIQQKNTMRYLDAFESLGQDFHVVTRPAQHDTSQEWVFTFCNPTKPPTAKPTPTAASEIAEAIAANSTREHIEELMQFHEDSSRTVKVNVITGIMWIGMAVTMCVVGAVVLHKKRSKAKVAIPDQLLG